MIIENQKYLVIKELSSRDDTKRFLLKKEGENKFYNVTRQKHDTVTGDEVKFLLEQTKNSSFVDFFDYVTKPDYLYVFMRYEEHDTVEDKLDNENCRLVERLEIMKKIIEKIIILNMPIYFLNSIMCKERIFVSRELDITFDYDLYDLAQFDKVTRADVSKKLAELFRFVFKREIEMKAIDEIDALIRVLEDDRVELDEDLMRIFYPIYTGYQESTVVVPKTAKFKSWEKIKSLGKYVELVGKITVLVVALAYLGLSIKNLTAESEVNTNFTTIGTQEIRNTEATEITE